MRPRLLVIQHQDICPPGWFGDWLDAEGIDLDVLDASSGRAIPAAPADHDGLLVLGGEMGASDDDLAPWLVPTRALIATVVGGGMPFLGICLGHQLAATALGGRVERNPNGRSRGLTPFRPNPAGQQDALLGSVRPGSLCLQSNQDVVVQLPNSAETLATFPDGTIQAARFGPSAWGVQFHPEAGPAIFDRWLERGRRAATPEEAAGFDALSADAHHHASRLRRTWQPLADRFARVLTGSART